MTPWCTCPPPSRPWRCRFTSANDIRLLSCGPRAGFYELIIPANKPGLHYAWQINPTQCEALTMIAVQVMALDVAVAFGGAGGFFK